MPKKAVPAVERFFSSFVVNDKTGCWDWTGAKAHGYGIMSGHRAHRFSYEHFIGPIADGLEPDHLCEIPGCVNPGHLEPVTHLENVRRSACSRRGTRPKSDFNHRLRGARGKLKATQRAIYTALSIPRRTYEDWELGLRVPNAGYQAMILNSISTLK